MINLKNFFVYFEFEKKEFVKIYIDTLKFTFYESGVPN